MNSECEIIEQPEMQVASIRMTTSVKELPRVIREAYGEIIQYLQELGEMPAGAPFAAYYNMDMENLDVEIGFPVTKLFPDKNRIRGGQLPAAKVATCLYTGSYQEMEPAYTALSRWMEENHCQPSDVVYEFYLNDPQETPPEKLETKIVFPIKA